MENKEQMIQVANNCRDYETKSYKAVKSCENCINYAGGECLEGMYEPTLITLD
jgi:hypothetical protein